jgi:hypothetical protein
VKARAGRGAIREVAELPENPTSAGAVHSNDVVVSLVATFCPSENVY